MLFSLIIQLFALAVPTVLAVYDDYTLPDSMENGIYELTFPRADILAKGTEVIVTQYVIDPDIIVEAEKDDGALPLPVSHKECSSDYHPIDGAFERTVNATDADVALRRLENWCEYFSPRYQSVVVSVENGVLWHVCSLNKMRNGWGNRVRCSRKELRAARDIIDEECGRGNCGTVEMNSWDKHYGLVSRRTPICDGIRV